MSSTGARPSRGALLRDWLSYAGGWFLILTQSGVPGLLSPPDQPHDTLIWAGMVLLSVQGGFGAASLIASRFGGTPGSPSQPAPQGSPEPSSSGA